MPVPRKHGETVPHPVEPERIRLLRYRRGPHDPRWEAQFRLKETDPWSLARATGETDQTKAAFKAYEMLKRAQGAAARGDPPFDFRKPKRAAVRRKFTSTPSETGRTFADVAEGLVRELIAERDRKIAETGRRSAGHNEHQHILRIRNKLIPYFGAMPVAEIDKVACRRFVMEYRARGKRNADGTYVEKRPSMSTIASINHAFRMVLDRAVVEGVISDNEGLKLPQVLRGSPLRFDGSKPRPAFTVEEVERIVGYMTNEWVWTGVGPDRVVSRVRRSTRPGAIATRRLLRAYVHFVGCTGIRPGREVEYIRWSQLRTSTDQRGNPYHYVVIRKGESKTGKKRYRVTARDVVVREHGIPTSFALALDDLRILNPEHGPDDFMFRLPGGRFPAKVDEAFGRLLEDLDLTLDPETGLGSVSA